MFLLKNIEEILASIAISITVLVVIVNVVLRYGFGFVVPWSEELSVICFIWAVYLGISSCYKHKLHMGVDVVVAMLPEKAKIPFRLCVSVFLLALNILMAVLSYQYLMLSNKVTPVMGVSYFVINGVLLLCFSLMAIHTVRFIANDAASLKRSSK
ncbi:MULTISPECIES: TRAP transporter small permease [Vibrio]|uniref:TRAP transporter small permease protein n=1 Tax=Vibrio chagasii TaxID=170679 RepID=A0A7Y4DQH8_9VIBR|nr:MULTISPECIES: TRAP transporter small permease [Vibrio]NOH32347.1 TRAP transporter small permease [Vibrio chagasii]CDT36188.1 Tripartite ATP-independent periplasmic transporter DctQ component [Vibrio coralliirubri]CDT36703.1 Tripartite ATP-independent periplasmic transporter DctQ component [Vibrio coralliirubri]CDT87231.1 Tripartite ATP-independent periplasmic transporter DctQ component [Vibrio coralliirubri]CDT94142.1 Tripartite ATP-independent periplasmic transporter DctQ component [Vibrio